MLYLTTSFHPNVETVAAYVSSLRRSFCKLLLVSARRRSCIIVSNWTTSDTRWPGKRCSRNDERRIDTYDFNFDKFHVCVRMNPNELRNQFGCRLVDPGYCTRVPCTMLDHPSVEDYGFWILNEACLLTSEYVSVCNVIHRNFLRSSTIYLSDLSVIFVYNLPRMVTQRKS